MMLAAGKLRVLQNLKDDKVQLCFSCLLIPVKLYLDKLNSSQQPWEQDSFGSKNIAIVQALC